MLSEATPPPRSWFRARRRPFGRAVRSWLALLVLACSAREVQADGKLMLRDRELFRVGPEARKYCEVPSDECPVVMSKVLSGYGFLRGALRGAASFEPQRDDAPHVSGFGALHLDAVSAALPG